MKGKLLFTFCFLAVNWVFSQSGKLLTGIVSCEQYPISKVDVAHYNSQQVVTTDGSGAFSIKVNAGDELVFISQNHDIKKIKLDQKTIDFNNLLISLNLKAEELKEVIITKIPSIKLSTNTKWEQQKINEIDLLKSTSRLKNDAIYNGAMENSADFIKIASTLSTLFKKEKEPAKKEIPKIEFVALARKCCDEKFYFQTLQLKPDEIALFLQFCEADPKSQKFSKEDSALLVMDFLINKNIDFKKL